MKKSVISVAILASAALLGMSGSDAATTKTAAKTATATKYLQIIQVVNHLADTTSRDSTTGTESPVIITYTDITGAKCWAPPKSPTIGYQSFDSVAVCPPGVVCGCHQPIKEISIDPQPVYGPGSPVAYTSRTVSINPTNDSNITATQIIIYQDQAPKWNGGSVTNKGTIQVLQQEK